MSMRLESWIALLVGASFALTSASAGDAFAKGKKKKPKVTKPKAKGNSKADNKAIGELMGGYEFGMSPKDVMGILYKRIDEGYADAIAGTTDVYEHDRLRQKMKKDKKRIKSSYIKFDGKKSGWDVSIVDTEFAQKNDESMLVHWERDPDKGIDQRRFFFFVDGELYKMFIAFNATMFPEDKRSFEYFQQIMEARYGPGDLVWEDDKYGEQKIKHLSWRDDKTFLRAINKLEFYGTFALAIESSKVNAWIADRRLERNPKLKERNAIIDSVTEDPNKDDTSLEEGNANVIDSIVGGNK